MRIIPLLKVSLFLLLFFSKNSYSQGGDNASAALSSPITLPFSSAGTTCGHVDNYNPLSPYGITSGKDWLYYFCAPTTGTVDIFMTNAYGLSPAIMVYSVTPNAGGSNWFATSFTGGQFINSLVTVTVTAGTCYYVMIDNYPAGADNLENCFSYTATIRYHTTPPSAPLEPACSNIGYDSGNLSGWAGTTGTVKTGTVGASTPAYTPLYYATDPQQHVVTSGAGVDPYGGFPVVNPAGGSNSVRLGDMGNYGTGTPQNFGGVPGAGGATLEQKFTVTPSNALFVYYYAVVIQNALSDSILQGYDGLDSLDIFGNVVYATDAFGNPILVPHKAVEQPFFKTDVIDCSGNYVACGQYLVKGGPNIPGFALAPGTTDVYYKSWTPVAVDLTPFIGTCVTVRYTVGDCTVGGHFAYAYLDAVCSPLAITGINKVCPTKSTTLTAPTGLFTYSWTPGGATTQSIVVTPTTTTTYSCELTSYTNCKTYLTYSVSLFPDAVASINSQTICSGTSALLTSTVNNGAGTYSWSPGGSTATSLSPSPSATTIYTLTYTDGNGCKDTAQGRVTVNPLPNMLTPSNVVVCHNAAIPASIFSSTVAGTTYSWTNTNTSIGLGASGAGNTPGFTGINQGAVPVSAVISVTPTANLCVGTPINYTITVNPIPNVDAIPSATYCAGATVPVTAVSGSVTSTTYSWTNTNAAIGLGASGIGNIPSYNTSNTGTSVLAGVITITPSANSCVGTPTNYTVLVNPIPNVNAVPSSTYCSGSVVPSTTFTETISGTVFNWANTNSSIGLGASGSGNIPSYTATNSGSGSINGVVSVTPSLNTCVGTPINYTITVNPNPLSPTVANPTVCPSATATLIATAPGGTYSWYDNNPGGNLLSTNPVYTTPGLTTTTAYYVNATNSFGCIGPFTQVVVTVLNFLPVSASPNQTICIGANATLGANPNGAGYSFSWDSPGNTAFSTVFNPIVSPTITTNYTVTVISPDGCTGINQTQVVVNPLPIADAGNPIAFCNGQSGTIGVPAIPGYSYSWLPPTGLGSTTVSNPNITLPNTGSTPLVSNYTVTVSFNGCQSSDQVSVTVNPLPVSDAGNPITLCAGQSGLIGSSGNVGYSYAWSPATNLSSSSAANPSVNGVNNGASAINVPYVVTTTDMSTSCQSTDQVIVTVLPLPTVNAGSAVAVCEGTSNIPLQGTMGGSVNGNIWSGGAGSFSSSNSILNPLYSPTSADYTNGSLTLTLTAIAIAPCQNVSSTVQIDFYKKPVINFTVDKPKGCPEHCVTFTDQSVVPAPDYIQSWTWNFGDGSSSTSQNPSHCYAHSGFYSVTLTAVSNHMCSGSLSIPDMIEVYQTPIASFNADPPAGTIIDPNISFNNTSQGATTYSWGFGDPYAPGAANTSTVTNPTHVYTNAGEYVVTLIATSVNGCEDRASVTVDIKPEFTFYIPNAFTPNNNDRVNDVFTGMGIGIDKYEMWIFDRWGAMIYYTDDINKGWDGRKQGKSDVVQQDVYVWKVKLTDVFSKKHEYIGHVTLLK